MARILMAAVLSLMLASASPAWCACILSAITDAYTGQGDRLADECCDHNEGKSDESRLPCPDRGDGDCACCDSTVTASSMRKMAPTLPACSAGLPENAIVLPPVVSLATPSARVCDRRSGAPPTLYAQRALLLI